MWWSDGVVWAGWIVMTLAMVAFWALVIWGLAAIFRGVRDDDATSRPHEYDPRRIVDERFARGEIDADEYHARQRSLRAPH